MELNIEFFNPDRMALGIVYYRGSGEVKDEPVIFHEFGIGLLFINIYFTFY
jgi:hypothetical protein